MQKTSCLIFLLLLSYLQTLSREAFNDSTGKDELKNFHSAKITLLKQSIVRTAISEFDQWRKDSSIREDNDFGVRKVKQYWRSVGKHMIENNLKDSAWQEEHPWSAAFISFVMKKAGTGNKFKPSPNHAGYIVWARQNEAITKDVFVAYDVCDPRSRWPEPGDLVSKNRNGNNFSLSTIRSSDISHSDIVVETDPIARTITTIGGNLNNTVSKRIIHLDEDGFIDLNETWQLLDEQKGNPQGSQAEFFAVIKLSTAKKLPAPATLQLAATNTRSKKF